MAFIDDNRMVNRWMDTLGYLSRSTDTPGGSEDRLSLTELNNLLHTDSMTTLGLYSSLPFQRGSPKPLLDQFVVLAAELGDMNLSGSCARTCH